MLYMYIMLFCSLLVWKIVLASLVITIVTIFLVHGGNGGIFSLMMMCLSICCFLIVLNQICDTKFCFYFQ